MIGITLDPPHNGWYLLPTLCLETLDEISAGLSVQ
jgi:hypothetical protein